MSKMFRTHQNAIGNLAVALLFVGGCIFLLTGSWDTSESVEAKGCCGGDATNYCGGGTILVAETAGAGNFKCDCLDPGNVDADCGFCTPRNYCSDFNTTNGSDCSGNNTGFKKFN